LDKACAAFQGLAAPGLGKTGLTEHSELSMNPSEIRERQLRHIGNWQGQLIRGQVQPTA
jgi:hypothetical protein